MVERTGLLSRIGGAVRAFSDRLIPVASDRRVDVGGRAAPRPRNRSLVEVDKLVEHFDIVASRRATGIRGPLPYRHLRAERMLKARARRAIVPTSFVQSDPTFSNPWWTDQPLKQTMTAGEESTSVVELTLLDGRRIKQVRRDSVDKDVQRRRKEFVAEMPDGARVSFDSIPHHLLPLDGVAQLDNDEDVVVVVEGTKAAHSLRERGVAAVATLTGALGTPSVAALEPLRGRHVVLWPDNDEVGVRHMQRVARRLAKLDPASLRVARWVGAPRKADAADFAGDADALAGLLDRATEWSATSPVGGRGALSVNTGPPAMRLSLPTDARPALGTTL